MKSNNKVILKGEEIHKLILKIAKEIAERYKCNSRDLALVGIRTGGVYLMERIYRILKKKLKTDMPRGIVDITLYRDDIDSPLSKPEVGETELLFDVNDKYIILIDDVLYTGRTIRAAIDVIIDFGRPKKIDVAVLIDRGHREIPFYAEFVGCKIETLGRDKINVVFTEEGKRKEDVVILERGEGKI
ncbi:MAG: bifunctional pyr operon transcriptional regulator/uracil phosphoribosyltransferase PyrR [Deltaproteobacteria bacterium]|nr:bifunctional pyr operon transcriptional regulator/uracil phosphoribosyltransferase PyrR [Deltaproteobacteria bacterium]